jgi:hypothetical protein
MRQFRRFAQAARRTAARELQTTASYLPQERIVQILKGALVAALLGLVGYVDVVTGYEISVFSLYALPIGLAVVLFGMLAGIATAGAAGLVWAWADVAAGHAYSRPWIIYVNAASRLVFFILVALVIAHIIATVRRARAPLRPLSGTLPVCTHCGKVADQNGYWWEVRDFLREFGGAVTQSKLCPDCAHEEYAEQQEPAPPIHR